MRLLAGSRDRKLGILFCPGAMQARNEIARQEWTVRRRAQDPGNLRPVRRDPVKRRQNARERSWKIGHRIGDDGQSKRREPRRIAVGVEDEPVALRLEPRDDTFEDGASGDLAQWLVAAAHPPRQAAGKQYR